MDLVLCYHRVVTNGYVNTRACSAEGHVAGLVVPVVLTALSHRNTDSFVVTGGYWSALLQHLRLVLQGLLWSHRFAQDPVCVFPSAPPAHLHTPSPRHPSSCPRGSASPAQPEIKAHHRFISPKQTSILLACGLHIGLSHLGRRFLSRLLSRLAKIN